MPAAVPAMEGQLKKRGAKIGVMHDRYCVATWEVDQAFGKYILLRSFKNRKSYTHNRTKPSSSTAVRSVADWDGRSGFSRYENAFQMESFDGQVVLCAAPTADEKARWLAISPAGGKDSPEVARASSTSELKQLGRTSSAASNVSGMDSNHRLSMRYLEQGWCSQGGVGSNPVGRGDFRPSDLPLVTGFVRDVDLDGAESFTTESESGDAAWAEFMSRGTSAQVSTEDTREELPEDDLDVARSVAIEEALTMSDLSSVAEDTSSVDSYSVGSSSVDSVPRSVSVAVPRSRAYSRGCSIVNDTPSNHAAKLEISDLPLEPVSVKVARLEAKLSGTDFSLSAAGEAARESDLSTSSRGSIAKSLPIKQEESVSLSAQPKSAPPTVVPAPVPVPTPVASTPAASPGTAQEAVPIQASSPDIAPTSVVESSVPAVPAAVPVSAAVALPPVEEEVKASLVSPVPSGAVRVVESSPSEPSTPTALSTIAFKLKKDTVTTTGTSKAAGGDVSDKISSASTSTSTGPLSPPPRVRAYSSAMLNSLETFSPPTHPRVRRYSFNSPHPAPGLAPHMLTMSSPLKPNFVEPHLGYVHSSISMMVPSYSTLRAPLSRQQSLDVQSEEDEDAEDDGHFSSAGRKPRAVSSLSLTQESDIDEV